MERNARTKKLKIAIIAIALLLCFALAVGITTAFYQAQRRAMGSVKMDQGIIIDYKGFNKGDENIWQREATTTFKLFEERDAQPGEQIYAYPAGIRANAESVDFYARLKLEYSFYNVVGDVETPVALANPKSLITTSSTFFDSNWVVSTDGYYYYGAGTVLNKFSKDATNYIDIFAKDGEGNVVAQFLIEGANFVGETAGEGGGFVVNGTAINKIVVLLTLETLQGDADAAAEGWKITKSSDQTIDVSGETEADITIDDIISGDRDGEITIAGDPAQPLTITIGSKAFYGCSKLKLTLSNSENIEYRIATDAFSTGATIMYGIDNVSSKLINPSTSGHTTVGFDGRWQVSAPGLYLFLPSPITPTTSSYGDFQYTDDQGTWYFDLIDSNGNTVTLSSNNNMSVSTLGASTYANTNTYSAKLRKFVPNEGITIVNIPKFIGISQESNKYAVTELYYTFQNCSGLTSITIPDSVTCIGGYAFYCCINLTSITIPDSVTSIGTNAFQNCIGITSITIPDSVTSVGESAFYGCSNLTSITIPDSVTSIEQYAFNDCSGLTSITIPDSVTSIGERAFNRCSGLTSITIPDGVTSIGDAAFSGCSSLTSIIVASGNTKYHSTGNCLIETVSKTLITGCKNSEIPTDGSVTSIRYGAFEGHSGITSITIPNSVTSIGMYGFRACTGLTSITIGNGVTSIGNAAFEFCSGLTSIDIPEGVTSIGDWAFSGCSGLTTITIPSSVSSIGDGAFAGCSGLTSVVVKGNITAIRYRCFGGCSNLESIVLPSSVTTIEDGAFRNCSKLTTIYVDSADATAITGLGFTKVGDTLYNEKGVADENGKYYKYSGAIA